MKHVVSSALLLGLSSLSLAAQAAPIALDLPAQPLAASLEQLQGASGLQLLEGCGQGLGGKVKGDGSGLG
ncbi:hypothetical protein, partial [Pseudomonas aeruginosa]|uniref:hypothetical protein n=1 Tax=Pseudomonas aeruginosa TaxID=287 RepID=UPI00117A87C3